MTLDEAVAEIRRVGECIVVADVESGEVIEVRPGFGGPDDDHRRVYVGAPWIHAGRRIAADAVTVEGLAPRIAEARTDAKRLATYYGWVALPPAELVALLESFRFEDRKLWQGPLMIAERLFLYPRDAIEPFAERVEHVMARRRNDYGFDGRMSWYTRSKLAVIARDLRRFRAVWERDDRPWVGLHSHPDFSESAGDLGIPDPDLIEILLLTVSGDDLLYGHRGPAMQALGKIGAPSGPRAVQIIRAHIFDSTPGIIAERERVIERIETSESAWQPCPSCSWGMVPRNLGSDTCQTCLGLAVVRRA